MGSSLRECAGVCLRLLPTVSSHRDGGDLQVTYLFRNKILKQELEIPTHHYQIAKLRLFTDGFSFSHLRISGVTLGYPGVHGLFRQQVVESAKNGPGISEDCCFWC